MFNSSAKGLKMLAVCSIKTSEISNPDTQGNTPKIHFITVAHVLREDALGKCD
jgi:hypothetical protein